MIAPICRHEQVKKHGKNRNGTQPARCLQCGATWTVEAAPEKPKPLAIMRVPVEEAKQALWLLT
jgi:transposase-like protein